MPNDKCHIIYMPNDKCKIYMPTTYSFYVFKAYLEHIKYR